MNHYCEKCSTKTVLIRKADSNNFGCPRCHSQFELDDNNSIRLAQFGGNMAKPTMHGPGSSPVFKGLNRSNQGINSKYETSIDHIISRTHNPAPLDPERNLEKRLEIFHTQAEEDMIPYKLKPKERVRLQIRKQIRRREKFYEDAAKRIDTNTVEYIKDHFAPSENQITSIEEQLSSKRKYEDNKPSSISEDESPEQIRPERRHSIAKTKHGLTSPFFNQSSEEPFAENNYNPKLLKDNFPYTSQFGELPTSNKKLNDYLDEKEYDIADYLNKLSNSFNFQNIDETYGTNSESANLSSKFDKDFKKLDLSNLSIEEALSLLDKTMSPGNLPQIKSPQDVSTEKLTTDPSNPLTKYKSMYPGGTTPIPGNHNV